MSRCALLRQIPIFSSLTDTALMALEESMVLKRLPPGGVLIEESAPGACAYAVLSGRLKVTTAASGRDLALNIVGPGSLIGELALLDPGPRSASALALDPVRVLVLHRRDLLPFLQRHPEAALSMMTELVKHIRQLSRARQAQAILPLAARLRHTLDDLAGRFGHDTEQGRLIDLALSQGELGQMVGASRESVNKQLRMWQKEGLVILDRGYITLTVK